MHDGTAFRLLYKLLRFWGAGAEIHSSCWSPKRASELNPLLVKPAPTVTSGGTQELSSLQVNVGYSEARGVGGGAEMEL